jgi:hypothetical protein
MVLDGFMAPFPLRLLTRCEPGAACGAHAICIFRESELNAATDGGHRQKPAFNAGGSRTIRQQRVVLYLTRISPAARASHQ